MKNLFTFIFIALLSMSGLSAQTDAERVANWQLPIDWWFAGATAPAVGIDAYPRKEAMSTFAESFDAATADFDAAWAYVPGNGNVIANTLGLPASNTGPNDFKDAAFKVLNDGSNMYILIQFTDDDVTGTESVELCMSPYFKLDVPDRTDFPTAWYTRWSQFGANKFLFDKNGFNAAMMVNVDTAGVGHINWGGTTETFTNNLFLDDRTAAGSKTVKWIITVGYPALTGEYRPDFSTAIWKALNNGKGISFDLKVNDVDTDDAFDTSDPPVKKPAEYWWNSDTNDCWQSNMFAGFLGTNTSGSGLTDAEIVANWQLPIDWWFAGATAPAVGIDAYPRKEANAAPVASFDAATVNFDAAWGSVSGNGDALANALGLPASNTGPNDFKDAAFKVLYDESNMYVLLQFTDDDVTGTESVELCLSPYFKLDVADRTDFPTAWYTRWSQFGANKLLFDKNGFNAAMMVNVDAAGVGHINWGGSTDIFANNLFFDDHTAAGSKTVKWIITIGYPALTGDYRPEFNTAIWKALNNGKGISFDLKVNDVDTDDAFDTSDPPVKKPAEYWWNSDTNDCWQSNMFAGFLGTKGSASGIEQTIIMQPSIFYVVTPDRIQFNKAANVTIYNTLGQQILSRKNILEIDLSNLKSGFYIIRANNEARKIVR
ncbi:MAG: T9SS C-terminal target domain-containing protein [Porphyromonadaceae bacterium]|nr:MAG: T9SS C-terminal target domain-containing protein [Porphyromonadaceae bacterium]